MDESYSYGLMNYDKLNITDNEDFFNKWHSKDYFLDYLTVSSEEVANLNPVYENQKNDVHPPLYYLLLRGTSSVNTDSFSKWSGLILNLIIFTISSVLIYLITKQLFKNEYSALLTVLVNGFIIGTLEMSLYIRMYELLSFFIIVLTYLIIKLLNSKKLVNFILLGVILILGGLTHYHFFIFAVGIISVLGYYLIKEKRYKELIYTLLVIFIAALLYLCIFSPAINHIFFSYRGVGQSQIRPLNFLIYAEIINIKIIPIIIIPMIIFILLRKKNYFKEAKLLLIPIIFYFLIIALSAPYQDLRYIVPIAPIIIIATIYILKENKILLTAAVLLILLPKTSVEMIYPKYSKVANQVEIANVPLIYIYNNNHHRFLDDMYLFTKVDKSYIVKENQLPNEQILTEKYDGIYVIIAEFLGDDIFESVKNISGFNNYKKVAKLNSATIYYYY